MRASQLLPLLIGLVPLAGASARAQGKDSLYEFRVWQFLPDSSRASPGTLSGIARGNEDFHMFIALGSVSALFGPDVRLDGDFVVHQINDSTLLVGDITAIRVLSRDSALLFARNFAGQDRLERRTYRLRATTTRRAPVWFYPFGVPQRGERGIAFELTSSDTQPARSINWPPRQGAAPISYGIDAVARSHRARVRVEVGDRAFEDDVLTRVPVRIAMKGGARGQDLMFELEAKPAGAPPGHVCWRWFWADERPPGGSACERRRGEAVEQKLDGSAGLRMRVTLLSPG